MHHQISLSSHSTARSTSCNFPVAEVTSRTRIYYKRDISLSIDQMGSILIKCSTHSYILHTATDFIFLNEIHEDFKVCLQPDFEHLTNQHEPNLILPSLYFWKRQAETIMCLEVCVCVLLGFPTNEVRLIVRYFSVYAFVCVSVVLE